MYIIYEMTFEQNALFRIWKLLASFRPDQISEIFRSLKFTLYFINLKKKQKKSIKVLCRGNPHISKLSIIASLHNFYLKRHVCIYWQNVHMLYCECLQLPHQITSLISQEPTEAAKWLYTIMCHCYAANKSHFPNGILFPSKLDVRNKHNFPRNRYSHLVQLRVCN